MPWYLLLSFSPNEGKIIRRGLGSSYLSIFYAVQVWDVDGVTLLNYREPCLPSVLDIGGKMYQIVTREDLTPEIHLFEIMAPDVAKKAQAGQFVVIRWMTRVSASR